LTLELRETPLGEIVESCVRGLEAEARARRVQLELALADPLPDARCAPQHVQRVLLNLLTNALRHTPSDGSVVVTARPVGADLEVLVEDTGEGLTDEAQARMFERFWRADAARTRPGERAGLGLAIARGLLEAQGGRIWAENQAGGGARVGFSLPIAKSSGRRDPRRPLVPAER
jgi:two-component system sensor histidine kinase SaeS